MGQKMPYKQLHIYRRSFAIKGCQKPMSRHTKIQKNAPRSTLFIYAGTAKPLARMWLTRILYYFMIYTLFVILVHILYGSSVNHYEGRLKSDLWI